MSCKITHEKALASFSSRNNMMLDQQRDVVVIACDCRKCNQGNVMDARRNIYSVLVIDQQSALGRQDIGGMLQRKRKD
jgi:hypothetical protein